MVELTYGGYVRVTRIMRQYLEAAQLVDHVSYEDAAGDRAAGKDGLDILHLDSAFAFEVRGCLSP